MCIHIYIYVGNQNNILINVYNYESRKYKLNNDVLRDEYLDKYLKYL